jgi:uncharacterized lipoprotein YmbA
MQWRSAVRAWGASRQYLSRPIGVLAIAALAASAAGCSSMPSAARLSLASAASSGGATVAFESIDGPPPEVFRKLVADLNDEAGARKIAVVSRSGAATYRIRGYVSALVERDKTSFAWVWDVYDTDKRRTLRISGEEPAAAGKRRDAWLAADEQVLRRMARNGMEQFAGFLNSSEPAPPPIVPEPALVTMASARDDSPEAAGIFRVFGAEEQPAGSPAPEAADVPAPPPAPKAKKQPSTATAALARSTDGRAPAR